MSRAAATQCAAAGAARWFLFGRTVHRLTAGATDVAALRFWVKISQVRTLSTKRLGRKLGRLSGEELGRIVEGLEEILG